MTNPDLVQSFGRVVDRLMTRLPLRVTYSATTLGGRRVQVHVEYDPGCSDTVGPVAPYTRVLRVLDAQTFELLVDDGYLADAAADPLLGPELAHLEATARGAAELAALRGGLPPVRRPMMELLADALMESIVPKPNLVALCKDIRAAANALPVGTERRLVLMEILIGFSSSRFRQSHRDVTAAEADAFRLDHGIPKRVE